MLNYRPRQGVSRGTIQGVFDRSVLITESPLHPGVGAAPSRRSAGCGRGLTQLRLVLARLRKRYTASAKAALRNACALFELSRLAMRMKSTGVPTSERAVASH